MFSECEGGTSMNVEHLFDSKKVVYSLEVFPPKKSSSVDAIYNTLYGLRGLKPDFISVTYGAAGSETQRIKTGEIAALILSEYGVEPISHLTCAGSTKEDIRAYLDMLKEKKVQNILALRGDITPDNPVKDFAHATDLMRFIKEYDDSFNISGACYPEGHPESEDFAEDIENMKRKVDAGCGHFISQLFFDNNKFYEFCDRVKSAGIDAPVEAGIMPITKANQIERMVTMSGSSVPSGFSKMLSRYCNDDNALMDAGIFYATQQILELLDHDVRGIHLYTMNSVEIATRITNSVENIIHSINNEDK